MQGGGPPSHRCTHHLGFPFTKLGGLKPGKKEAYSFGVARQRAQRQRDFRAGGHHYTDTHRPHSCTAPRPMLARTPTPEAHLLGGHFIAAPRIQKTTLPGRGPWCCRTFPVSSPFAGDEPKRDGKGGGAGGGWSVLQSARNACGCGRFPSKQGCQLRDRAIGGQASARGDPASRQSGSRAFPLPVNDQCSQISIYPFLASRACPGAISPPPGGWVPASAPIPFVHRVRGQGTTSAAASSLPSQGVYPPA